MDAFPADVQVEADGPEWLIVSMEVPGIAAGELLGWFVDARKINAWWGSEAIVEPRPGGRYLVHWTATGWTMRGTVAAIAGDSLTYSWTWDHEPDQAPRMVHVHVDTSASGAVVTIVHGPYPDGSAGDPEAGTDRAGHREGWLYFLPQLRAKIASAL